MCAVRGVALDGRVGKRKRAAVNAAVKPADWLLNRDKAVPQNRGKHVVTNTLRHGMQLKKQSDAHSACLIFECVYLCLGTHCDLFLIVLSKRVQKMI